METTKPKKAKSKGTKTIIKLAVIIGVLIIPLLYSYFYLGAFWDPYAQLDDVPVAVVNLDQGAVINGEKRNVGDEVCTNLRDDGSLAFDFTDSKTAKDGVKGDKYYAEIVIPKDFSKNISKASKDEKKVSGTISYIANQKRNYLAAQILENAMPTIKETINGNINEEIVCTLTDKLYEVPDGLEKLSDGLQLLFDGSGTLKNGTAKLSTATITVKNGTKKLSNGATDLTSGLTMFKQGTAKLDEGAATVDAGTGTLKDGITTLKDGTQTLYDNIPTLQNGVEQLNSGAQQVNDGATQVNTGAYQVNDGAQQLSTGSASLAVGAKSLDTGIKSYTSGVEAAAAGSSQLSSGAQTLESGTSQLLEGISQIKAEVKTGSDTLEAADLTTNIETLITGAQTLDTNLTSYTAGVNQIISSYETSITLLTQSKDYITNATLKAQVEGYLNAISTAENQTNLATIKASGSLLTAGSGQIKSGVTQLRALESTPTEMEALYNALTLLESGATDVNNGAKQLSAGTVNLDSGLNTLTQNNDTLTKGAATLNSGAATVSSGAADLFNGTTTLYAGTTTLSSGATTLYNGTSTLLTSSGTLAGGVTSLNIGATDLLAGVTTLKGGTAQVASGASQINSKTTTIKNGSVQLKDGIDTLNDGADKLQSGVKQLDSGAADLKDGTNTAKTQVDDNIADTNSQMGALDGLSTYASAPVKTSTDYDYPVANYGSAFAPYFMSLSMWVGGLMIFFGIYLDYERKIKMLSKSSDHVVLRAFAFMSLGIMQAILLAFVIHRVLGIDVNNVAMLYLGCCVVSLAFISIIQFCLVHLGDAGKFVALLLLILQLTSCAGTFPLETLPKMFQVLYPFMPMTYSVQLFKESISGEWNANATKSFVILVCIMVAFTLITTLLSAYRDRHKLKEVVGSAAQKVQAN